MSDYEVVDDGPGVDAFGNRTNHQRWDGQQSPTPKSETDAMTRDEALEAITTLVNEGWLMGVAVFGGDPADDPENEWSFGLCDRFGPHTPGGSDCNRAAPFIVRPHDDLMTPELRALVMAEDTEV